MPFQISETTQVSEAGAYMVTNGQPMFAAIVSLTDASDLPSGSPFDSSTLAASLFTPGMSSDDYFAQFNLTLQPGWYGLVIGAGYFGSPSTAGGLLVQDGPGSTPNLFGWSTFVPPGVPVTWSRGGGGNFRMVVEDNAPEPGSWVLIVGGLSLVGASARFRRKRH
jgi:hypothetical protein